MDFSAPQIALKTLRTDISLPFSASRFSIPHHPVSGGLLPVSPADFALPLPSCLDMLVKLPAQKDLTLPNPYHQHRGLLAFINRCLELETSLLASNDIPYFAYLTVDNRLVSIGKTHRNAGWHFDGMQGTRYPKKLLCCHQYVVSDCLPTEFACSPKLATNLDEATHNWFTALASQVTDDEILWSPRPYEVVAMSAYHLHRSIPADTPQGACLCVLTFPKSSRTDSAIRSTPTCRLRGNLFPVLVRLISKIP